MNYGKKMMNNFFGTFFYGWNFPECFIWITELKHHQHHPEESFSSFVSALCFSFFVLGWALTKNENHEWVNEITVKSFEIWCSCSEYLMDFRECLLIALNVPLSIFQVSVVAACSLACFRRPINFHSSSYFSLISIFWRKRKLLFCNLLRHLLSSVMNFWKGEKNELSPQQRWRWWKSLIEIVCSTASLTSSFAVNPL